MPCLRKLTQSAVADNSYIMQAGSLGSPDRSTDGASDAQDTTRWKNAPRKIVRSESTMHLSVHRNKGVGKQCHRRSLPLGTCAGSGIVATRLLALVHQQNICHSKQARDPLMQPHFPTSYHPLDDVASDRSSTELQRTREKMLQEGLASTLSKTSWSGGHPITPSTIE
jgi:hypothetical protein